MTKIVTRTRKQAFLNWIDALESGKYRQTQGQLRDSHYDRGGHVRHSFCCLGVLCDLARKDGGPKWDSHTTEWYDELENQVFSPVDGELPLDMRQFMGMSAAHETRLISMNDDGKASFKEIAKYIRTVVMPEALKN